MTFCFDLFLSFILSTLGKVLYTYNSVAINGNLALKPVLRNIGNSQRNQRKTVDKLCKKRELKNVNKNILFSPKKQLFEKMCLRKYCVNFEILTKHILFFKGFRTFLSECLNISSTGFLHKFSLIATEYLAYKRIPVLKV